MKVLLAQCSPAPSDPAGNALAIGAALERNPQVSLALFPELFLSGYCVANPLASACALDDEHVACVQRAAAQAGTAVVFGLAERRPDGSVANSAACVDAHGRLVAAYRKAHLFGRAERAAFSAGDELLVVELAGRRVGLLICFDMEFPEPARQLVLGGARLLVTIAANMEPYGDDHSLASRARALDNRVPHLYVNRTGHEAGLDFVGSSAALAPNGDVLARAGRHEEDLVVELAPGAWPDSDVDYLCHRRSPLSLRRVGSDRMTDDPQLKEGVAS